MREFGWQRERCLQIDHEAFRLWGAWTAIINTGEFRTDQEAPYVPISAAGDATVIKALQNCFDVGVRYGYRAHELIDWIGYAIGIAWCSKAPSFIDEVEVYLEKHFPWEGLIRNPSDYLSHFLAENGSSGHLDYYPTPQSVSMAISMMMDPDWTESVMEPCIGPGSMVLSMKSLNIVGMDLNLLMVKAACIHAFFYKPSLLFTPSPILGLHVHPEEQRVHKYFEFNTDTRIYCGNSLLGEFYAPKQIFEQDSPMQDIYLHPIRERHKEVYQYREEMKKDWSSLPRELRFKLVKAMAREHSFDVVVTNPPFNVKLSTREKELMMEIEADNMVFFAELENRKPVEMKQLTLF